MNTFNKDPEYLVKIGTFINTKINKIETYVAIFSIITIALQQLLNQSLSIVFTGFLLILAMACFFSAIKSLPESEDSGINRFILKLTGYGSSLAIIGILFTISKWPGHNIPLNAAGLILIICIISILYIKILKKDSQLISTRIIIRIAILSAICAFLFFTPESNLNDIGFLNNVNNGQ